MPNHKSVPKRGFNLIEIAIVLAVVGLVIGGIYTAASAVTAQNRLQTHFKQIVQIVQNVRSAYATQPVFTQLSYAQIKALGLMPGDVTDTGTDFVNPYGGAIILGESAYAHNIGTNQIFLLQTRLPKTACIDLLSRFFGSAETNKQMGLLEAGTSLRGGAGVNDGQGVTVASAVTVCDQDLVNHVDLYFRIR